MTAAARNTNLISEEMTTTEAVEAYRVVKDGTYDTTNDNPTCSLATALTDDVIGVTAHAAGSGERVELQKGHGTYVEVCAGGVIAAGAEVMATTGGKVITAAGATCKSIGKCPKGATADGEIVAVRFNPQLKGPANS